MDSIFFNSGLGTTLGFSEPWILGFPYLSQAPNAGLYVVLVSDQTWRPRHFRPLFFGETADLASVSVSHKDFYGWSSAAGTSGPLYVAVRPMPSSNETARLGYKQALINCYPECNRSLLASSLIPPVRTTQGGLASLFLPPLGTTQGIYALFLSHAWDYQDEYNRLVDLLNAPGAGLQWRNLSIPEHDPVAPTSSSLPKSYLRLIRELERRITRADCVLILSGMYCTHSEWIQTEIELAQEHSKPIIGVKPRGQERIPEGVQQAANGRLVGWSTASIVSAIRTYATPSLGIGTNVFTTSRLSALARPLAHPGPPVSGLGDFSLPKSWL